MVVTRSVTGHLWHTTRCLICQRVFSIHHTLPYPRLPKCIRCRRRKLTMAHRQVPLFPERFGGDGT